ncbi:iron-containing redox enzyme family protein [Pseudonocardia sp. ICBG1293]|uniref:iron-containing redox enzyme family protein n=1 Tax=Pseudonocardia sp. ICBG1293 TaxID=2844382 RepID=UPI001CCCE4B6|nr:iron-containing redox enzyme family protein [Pseudonocardia sp. ICBG1293]
MTLTASSGLDTRVTEFMTDLEDHPVFTNDYFKFLEHCAWNARTYEFHRTNFFFRTEGTIKGIAAVCARAAANDDADTLTLFAQILNEEAGSGDPGQCHELLMESAHNLHGAYEFGLEPLRVKQSRDDALVIKETRAYRERTRELVNGSYNQMLGVAMALEGHADHMLKLCRKAFRATTGTLPAQRYLDEVEIYFNVHVGDAGVEERHAADARRCVRNNVRSDSDMDEIAYGATETLTVQKTMWDAMYEHVCKMNAGAAHGK